LQVDAVNKQQIRETEQERIDSQERIEGAKLGVKIASDSEHLSKQDAREGVKMGIDIAKAISGK